MKIDRKILDDFFDSFKRLAWLLLIKILSSIQNSAIQSI